MDMYHNSACLPSLLSHDFVRWNWKQLAVVGGTCLSLYICVDNAFKSCTNCAETFDLEWEEMLALMTKALLFVSSGVIAWSHLHNTDNDKKLKPGQYEQIKD